MRYSALIAASLASNAFASPLHKRVYVTDIDLVTITKYVTATGPCPTTAETSTVAVTQEAVTSSQVVVVSTVSSAAPVVESSSEAPAPVETTSVAAPAPVTTSSAIVEVSVSLAPSSTVVPETTATPSTSAVPTTTAAPTSSEVAGGFSFPAACPTTSLDSTASLTAQPTGAAAQRWLAFHNAHRANHTDGCSLLWDYDLEAKAQASAAKCIYDHDNTYDDWGQNMGQMQYGMTSTGVTGTVSKENLQEAPEFFTNMYYEEYNDFGPYWGAETVPTDGPNILHFTQMIWKNTYSVGCAISTCSSDSQLLTFCNYRARGNILDQYGDNVLEFISSPLAPICSEIGSTATDGSCITDAQLGL